MNASTVFHLKRRIVNYLNGDTITSEITRDLPGDVGAKQVMEFVRYDAWCGMLRESGFDLDPATIWLSTPTARE